MSLFRPKVLLFYALAGEPGDRPVKKSETLAGEHPNYDKYGPTLARVLEPKSPDQPDADEFELTLRLPAEPNKVSVTLHTEVDDETTKQIESWILDALNEASDSYPIH